MITKDWLFPTTYNVTEINLFYQATLLMSYLYSYAILTLTPGYLL